MNVPVRLERGKIISAVDGVVDTWDWFIDFLEGITGSKGVIVTKKDASIDISLEEEGDGEDEDEDDETLPEIPEIPPLDLSGLQASPVTVVGTDLSSATATRNIVFKSASDSNVKVTVAPGTGANEGDAIVTIGVYYN